MHLQQDTEQIQQIAALAFVPKEELNTAFEVLSDELDDDTAFVYWSISKILILVIQLREEIQII